ncbi:MAG: YeeE/YedE family protein [Anaerolineales bacterium]|nr:YeeE/YedE family protein [Anaerolineales bacterium]
MTPFPLDLIGLLGKPGTYLIFLLIGFGFGYALEISGFNKSTILAGQFYFRDSRVVKVFFTAIVIAMGLVFLTVTLGWLDYNTIWVPPTYLWPGIIGGLIMGVGFILGGFCPGTSFVAAATLKIDALVFVVGGLFGGWIFSETETLFPNFYNGSFFGRVTLMDLFNVSTGTAMLIVAVLALVFFTVMEKLEAFVTKRETPKSAIRSFAWIAPLVLSLAVLVMGDATPADKWSAIALEKESALNAREVQIHPGELLDSIADDRLSVVMIDVRPEADFNLFHIDGAVNIQPDDLPSYIKGLMLNPNINTTVHVVMSNDETLAIQAWKTMVAESLPNSYLLEGGINNWLSIFGADEADIIPTPVAADEAIDYTFPAALGSNFEASKPNPHHWELEYEPKIKLERKRGPSSGGCG